MYECVWDSCGACDNAARAAREEEEEEEEGRAKAESCDGMQNQKRNPTQWFSHRIDPVFLSKRKSQNAAASTFIKIAHADFQIHIFHDIANQSCKNLTMDSG